MLDFRDDSTRAKYFVSNAVPHLFDILKDSLNSRISDATDFYYNWYHFISFILFIIRCTHMQTDEKAYNYIVDAINDYLRGNSINTDINGMLVNDDNYNYITYFGQGRLDENFRSVPDLIERTTNLYEIFIKIWNDHYDNTPHLYLEANFANIFKLDENARDPNFSGSFNLLFREFSLNGDSGLIKLFNCRRNSSDKPRFFEKKIKGFRIE